jgi:Zn-dependent protease with chaperone function
MVTAMRAAVSVLMLVGFYLVAVAQLAVAVALALWLPRLTTGPVALKVSLPLFLAVGAVVVGTWRALWHRHEPPEGVPVAPDEAPDLWRMVRELAVQANTAAPAEIRLVPEVNASVSEDSRLMGLLAGSRRLYLGLPLLQGLTVTQMRAVVTHELGHYSHRHTRLGAAAYRGRLALAETTARIGRRNVAGWVFKRYADLYLRVNSALARQMEFEADRAAVLAAGRAATAGTLVELRVIQTAWRFFESRYLKPGWDAGYAPEDVFGGFGEMLAARPAELAAVRVAEPVARASWRDTHPAESDRIAAIAAAPEGTAQPDDRPAWVLVPRHANLARQVQREALDADGRTVLPWPGYFDAVATAALQREADGVFRAIGRQVPLPPEPNVGTLFDLIAGGRLRDIAAPVLPHTTRREAGAKFAEVLEPLLGLAAIRSGVARFERSWSGPAVLVGTAGQPLDLEEPARMAVEPGGLEAAYGSLVRAGIDITAAGLVERTGSAVGARTLAAISNVKVDGTDHDLIILDAGLVLVAGAGPASAGRSRLEGLVASGSADELARRHRLLPYEEIARVTVIREVPLRATLALHDGRALELHEAWLSELLPKGARDTLRARLTAATA